MINKNKGFTILETLVAITIILIAITGPLDIIAHSLKASYYSRDEVTAFYLAQEAIEYARNQRDNNTLNPTSAVDDWLVGATGNRDVGGVDCLNLANSPVINKCTLVQNSTGVYQYEACPNGTCPLMKRVGESGVYGSTEGDDTHFAREIYFTKIVDGSVVGADTGGQDKNEILITVNIYWSNNFGSDNKFTLTSRLYNWKLTE